MNDISQQQPYPSHVPVSRTASPVELPPLSAPEREHSERLVTRICQEIDAKGGWIGFARYMELALYEPGLGYYSAGATKFGAAGDFVTAPELSPLFSRCVANQCAEVLRQLKGGDILELGAGSGVMAADLLNELAALDALPERYFIMEVSADLKQRQLTTLAVRAAKHLHRVQWLDRLPGTKAPRPGEDGDAADIGEDDFALKPIKGVILANEVLDALPVDRFVIRAGEVNAQGVSWQLGRLEWSEARADRALTAAVRRVEQQLETPFADGYISDLNLRVAPWVRSLAKALRKGAVLLMDYGLPRRQYYRPDRHDGTLLCHFRHRFHDNPFVNVGVQDIGAWVDFTTVAESAVDAGLSVAGFTTQAHFLMGLGIERYLRQPEGEAIEPAEQQEVSSSALAERMALARQAMMLTLPGEMGERFKVIGLTKNYAEPLAGFSIRDMAASL